MKNTSYYERNNKEVGQKVIYDNRKTNNISFVDDNEFRDTVPGIVIY